MSQIKIGITATGYPEARNFINLPYRDVSVLPVVDAFRCLSALHWKVLGDVNYFTKHLYWDGGLNRCDLNHFFNGISLVNRPWFVTYETALPRGVTGRVRDFLTSRLAHESCRGLIALSRCALEIQEAQMRADYPHYYDEIMSKTQVMHPPQALLIDGKGIKASSDKLVFTLVGGDFFRKGGLEVLRVFERLIPKHPQLQLNIVSRMKYGDYASQTTRHDLDAAMQIIARFPSQITHWPQLENAQVLELLKASDVGLLPTWGDTYGYSALEAQAAGCPVVTTNIRAMPEINNSDCGWVIDVKKDSFGNGILSSTKDRKLFSNQIEEGLEAYVCAIIKNPDVLAEKSRASLERIEKFHDPKSHALKLEQMYRAALND